MQSAKTPVPAAHPPGIGVFVSGRGVYELCVMSIVSYMGPGRVEVLGSGVEVIGMGDGESGVL